jgi:hypothetical protein
MHWQIKREGKGTTRTIQYPVEFDLKVSKVLELTSGVDTIFIFACTKAMNRSTGSISHHFRYKKVSHLRNEMLASGVDAVINYALVHGLVHEPTWVS